MVRGIKKGERQALLELKPQRNAFDTSLCMSPKAVSGYHMIIDDGGVDDDDDDDAVAVIPVAFFREDDIPT